jgi:nucleoside-diphosphate-sugar epimerase/glycosyltransferase involved in cell wall biosynthesis
MIEDKIKSLDGPIIILGAAGFIGANLFKKILNYRKDVFAVTRESAGWRLYDVDQNNIISTDINDVSAAKYLVESINPKTIFDCISYGAYSFENKAAKIYATNFSSKINFFEILEGHKISAYIHAGSSSEYGLNCSGPTETSECKPNSDYAISKLAIAKYIEYIGKEKKMPVINLRLYSVYGPLEDSSRLIPTILNAAIKKSLPPLVNPEISRDFIYIDDVCNAFINAAIYIQPENYGDSFNIGTGIKTTIKDLVLIMQNSFAVSESPKYGAMDNRSWDLTDWFSNPGKALRKLNWKSSFDLVTGLNETYNWLQKNSDLDLKKFSKKEISGKRKSISAIIACYKDEASIPIMYARLSSVFKELQIEYEIIFVNDGSPDQSEKVITEISSNDNKVIGINHSRNFGSQMAYRSGMEIATKQAVVLLDGDLQDPPEIIIDFYKKWKYGYDVIYGVRKKREMPIYVSIFYKLFYRIFSALSYIKIPNDAGDFSLIDQKVVTWILKCPERDLFMRGLRAYIGFKQIGVDYFRPERVFGKSTNNFLKNLEWAKTGIFSFSNTPLTILTSMGILFLIISFISIVVVACLKIYFPEIAPKGITTVLIAILSFGSLNLFAIGLVGEYVAKIMLEVKGRPRLIRSSLIKNGKVITDLAENKKMSV